MVLTGRDRCCCFFFNDTATTEIYTLSLHDALPISPSCPQCDEVYLPDRQRPTAGRSGDGATSRSEEHTSELQSLAYLVCRLLLEKKKPSFPTVLATQMRPPPALGPTCACILRRRAP